MNVLQVVFIFIEIGMHKASCCGEEEQGKNLIGIAGYSRYR